MLTQIYVTIWLHQATMSLLFKDHWDIQLVPPIITGIVYMQNVTRP